MTPPEKEAANFFRLMNLVISHRVRQALGEVGIEAVIRDPAAQQLNQLLLEQSRFDVHSRNARAASQASAKSVEVAP